jgi:hypothetical protein
MIENIFVNINAPSLSTSRIQGLGNPVSRPFSNLVAGDTRTFNIYLTDGSGGYIPPSTLSAINCKIGEIGGVIYAEQSSALSIANGWQVEIPFTSTLLQSELGSGDISTLFEIETSDFSGSKQTIIQAPVTITGQVITSSTNSEIFKENFIVAVTNEVDSISVGSSQLTFRVPFHFIVQDVRASVTNPPQGTSVIVDIKSNGSLILSTPISIDSGEKTSQTSLVLPIISSPIVTDDSEIQIDVLQVGSTSAGTGLKVYISGRRG